MKGRVVVDEYAADPPKNHELRAAKIMAEYFGADVIFMRVGFGKTADFRIKATTWELKSPKGSAKNTIGNNLRKARHQSPKIILDLSRCGFTDERAISKIKDYLSKYKANIKKVVVIRKDKKVIEIL